MMTTTSKVTTTNDTGYFFTHHIITPRRGDCRKWRHHATLAQNNVATSTFFARLFVTLSYATKLLVLVERNIRASTTFFTLLS